MILHNKDGIEWLEFPLLSDQPKLKHGVILRSGGASKGAYSSLNLGFDVGDDHAHVQQNRTLVSNIFKDPYIPWTKQLHGVQAVQIEDENTPPPPEGDILLTKQKNVGLLIAHADCQATILYDPIQHVVANVHAGWRGMVLGVYQKAIEAMTYTYGSAPQNLLVGISPSLGPTSAEFVNYRQEFPQTFWEYQVKPFYFDLWAIAKSQLQNSGVLPHHIEIAAINTYDHPIEFFSYRRDKVTGRNGTLVALS